MARSEVRIPVLAWRLLTVAWAIHIFWMSTGSFSSIHSESILASVFRLLHISVAPSSLHLMNSFVRKVAHLAEYAIFGYLVYRSLGGWDRFRSQPHLATLCVLAASAYSLTDELHQAFVPGRHASLTDCAIDGIGAASAMLLVYASSTVLKMRSGKRTAQ